MPWGRGGAGNIEAQQYIQEAIKKIPNDLEAQRPVSEGSSAGTVAEQSTTETRSASSQQYAYSGRGGAGNWYSPRDMSSTGTFTSSGSSTEATSAPPVSPTAENTSESRHRGRGGAGNYVWSEEEQNAQSKMKEQKEIELQELARKDVDQGLQRPGRAFLRDPTDLEYP